MSPCPGIAEWEDYVQGRCALPITDQLRAHLNDCADCRELFGHIGQNNRWVGSLRALWPGPFLANESPKIPIGKRIGRYEITGLLGSGGMATVYRATQDHPRRTVALKVMKQGLASRSALRRFEHEAELLGRLQHPGIAQIFEAGVFDTDGEPQPFFAMELVEGRRLTDYASAHNLGVRERLELMVKIGEAVHHAHQKGIIHRDLKPSNILVVDEGTESRRHDGTMEIRAGSASDRSPSGTSCLRASMPSCLPKILDFGVARATDSDIQVTTLHTDIGQLIGTLPYMSPEQATGDPNELDVRSDVYALGVVCYELLAGCLPYEVRRKTVPEAVRIIREEDATPLSSVNKVFRGDIETIVATALEKDKTRRYPSASALVADIRRFLNDEPISARPPSATYQLAKFAQRNKTLVAGVLAVFVTLVLGWAGTSYGLLRATTQRNRAVESERVAETRRAEAETVIGLLDDMLGSAHPHQVKGENYTVRQLLDDFDRGLQRRSIEQPEVEATVRATMGNTYRGLGLNEPAERNLKAALDLRRSVLRPEHVDVARSLFDYAWLLHDKSDYLAAEQMFRETLEMQRKLLGLEHRAVAATLNGLSDVLRHQPKFEEAEPLAREALAMRQKLLGPDHLDVAESLNNLGRMLRDQNKGLDEAEWYVREALRIWRHAYGPEHPLLAEGLTELGRVLEAKGDLTAAGEAHRESLAMGRRVWGEEHPEVLRTLNELGWILMRANRYAEAEKCMRENLASTRKVRGDIHADVHEQLNQLGLLLTHKGDYGAAEPLFREAMAIERTLEPAEGASAVLMNLAGTLVHLDKIEEAERLADEALVRCRKQHGEQHPFTANALRITGLVQLQKGNVEEAQRLLRESAETTRRVHPQEPWRTARVESALGAASCALGQYAEAEALLTKSYATLLESKGTDFAETGDALRRLVSLYEAWGQPEKAAEYRLLIARP